MVVKRVDEIEIFSLNYHFYTQNNKLRFIYNRVLLYLSDSLIKNSLSERYTILCKQKTTISIAADGCAQPY